MFLSPTRYIAEVDMMLAPGPFQHTGLRFSALAVVIRMVGQ